MQFDELAGRHFGAILADPPWQFASWSPAGDGRNANRHYRCLGLETIKAVPVARLARRDAALFLWVTDPLLPAGLEVMAAWGFTFKTVAFTWVKRTARGAAFHIGTGFWTRANAETCILGTRGAPKRLERDVRQLILAPIREHSRKPDAIYASIERLVGGPYIELFARQAWPGWESWGHEARKFPRDAIA